MSTFITSDVHLGNPHALVDLFIGFVRRLPPDATLCMWIGAVFFHLVHGAYKHREGTFGHTIWVRSLEPICAGIIAGSALIGIGDKLIDVFVLPRL